MEYIVELRRSGVIEDKLTLNSMDNSMALIQAESFFVKKYGFIVIDSSMIFNSGCNEREMYVVLDGLEYYYSLRIA